MNISSNDWSLEDGWRRVDWKRNPQRYAEIRESRHRYVFPFIWQKIDALNPRSILDFGAGDGSFVKSADSGRFESITCYEPSSTFAELAKSNLNKIQTVELVTTLDEIKNSKFDLITFIAVWMTLDTEQQCLSALRQMHDRLNFDGSMIAAVTHPCFREAIFQEFHTDFSNTDYFHNGDSFTVFINDGLHRIALEDYHWNLHAMFNQLYCAGFYVERLWELSEENCDKKSPGSPWLILLARPIPR